MALALLALALVASGCSGQKTEQPQSEEMIAPEVPSGETESTAIPEPTPEPEPAPKPASKAKPKPAPKPEPSAKVEPVSKPEPTTELKPAEPEPAPEPIEVTVPAGIILDVSFLDPLSSKTSQAGQAFRTSVLKDIVLGDTVAIPAGSIISGIVTEAVPLKKIGGQAKLALDFSTLELATGEIVPIEASFAEMGKSETKKDTATIGGATAGGAILGRILSKKDKKKGTIIGAILGAAAGTVIASKTEGEEVEIPVGTELSLQLTESAKVTVIR